VSLKSWVRGHVHRINSLAGRPDLPPREPGLQPLRTAGEPSLDEHAQSLEHDGPSPWIGTPEVLTDVEHLGAYGPLIAAIRDELEHFVASHVRLHVVIADHDRFVLTSIGVRSSGAPDGRALLQQFMREFKPEQVKRYLARDVISGLPNASSIDLSQFTGLFDAEARSAGDEDGEYRELLEALRTPPPASAVRRWEIGIVGRWTEADEPRMREAPRFAAHARSADATPPTPLAGPRGEFEVVDGDGRRRVALPAVGRGRRYAIGKGESCDIRVSGTYTSRRHAEIWVDGDGWWVADAGSTNGVRVESPGGADTLRTTAAGPGDRAIRVQDEECIVLSARAEGPPADYPTIAVRATPPLAMRPTPIAAAAWRTPLTASPPIAGAEPLLRLTVAQASGTRSLDVGTASLPVTVGRSRNQTLVVDRRHDAVSGHHLDLVACDEEGAEVVVHGDNGVWVEGRARPAGARLRWAVGETLVLGGAPDAGPKLTLARAGREG
jgi:pSer/pThr/pTyr-binding forkhead associated (FHA) protein